VCVPRTSPRSEQIMRGLAFEKLGLLKVITPDALSPQVLRSQIGAALRLERRNLLERANGILSFDGAHIAARHLLASPASRKHSRANGHQAHAPEPFTAVCR